MLLVLWLAALPWAGIAAEAPKAAPPAKAAADSARARSGGLRAALALGIILLVTIVASLALPVIYVVGSLPSGLLSAVIIGVGMQQAWKMTRARPIPISGPYELGSAPAPAAAPCPSRPRPTRPRRPAAPTAAPSWRRGC